MAPGNMHKEFGSLVVWFSSYVSDRQTSKQTDILITRLRAPRGGELTVNKGFIVIRFRAISRIKPDTGAETMQAVALCMRRPGQFT